MWAFVASLFSGGLSALLSPVLKFFTSKDMFSMEEFLALTSAQQVEYAAYVQAVVQTNAAKLSMNATRAGQIMIYLFGIPAALHWNAVFLDSTFKFHWGIPALPGAYAGAEQTIALAFFITAPAMPLLQSFAASIGKK